MSAPTVAPDDVGRACPYCRFPLKGSAAAQRCDDCGALHHVDCWQDGGGCAVFGCTGGAAVSHAAAPAAAPTPPRPARPATAPPPAASAAAAAGAGAGATAPRNRGPVLLLVVLGLLVAIGIGAAIGLLARGGGATPAATTTQAAAAPAAASPDAEQETARAETTAATTPADTSTDADTDMDADTDTSPDVAASAPALTRPLVTSSWQADIPSADESWSVVGPERRNDGRQIVRTLLGPDGQRIVLVHTPGADAHPDPSLVVEERDLSTAAASSRLAILDDFPAPGCQAARCSDFLLNDPAWGGLAILANGEDGDPVFATAQAIAESVQAL